MRNSAIFATSCVIWSATPSILLLNSIRRQQLRNEQMLTVKALFWRLTVRWKEDQISWDLYIPFIEHLRQ